MLQRIRRIGAVYIYIYMWDLNGRFINSITRTQRGLHSNLMSIIFRNIIKSALDII